MSIWDAILLGLVEGITEYLPVSSTGHLLIVQTFLGVGGDTAANAYAIAIQAGAILAVLGLYRARVGQMVAGLAGRDSGGRRLLALVLLAFLPAAVTGLLFDDAIERLLFGPWPVVAAWVVGALAILAVSPRLEQRPGRELEALDARAAVIVGLMQCLALWPGTSRSLVTILGGLFAGLSLGAAVELSFLLGLVTLGAATAYKALQHGGEMMAAYGGVAIAVGLAVSWLSAVVAVKWMVRYLNRHGLRLFAWWRLAAAALVTGALLLR